MLYLFFVVFHVSADVVMQEGQSSDRNLFNFQEFSGDGPRLRGLASISCLNNDDCVVRCNTELQGACGYNKAKNGIDNNSVCEYPKDSSVPKCKCDCGGSSCFSHRSTVITEEGEASLQSIEVGDQVQTMLGLEPVIGFLHNSDMSATFLSIKHDQGVLEITGTHLVFLADGSSMPARDLQVGDRLSAADGASSLIKEINQIQLDGFSSPLTPSGTIIVNGIAASVYNAPSDAIPQWAAHLALLPLRAAYYLSWNSVSPESGFSMAPVVKTA